MKCKAYFCANGGTDNEVFNRDTRFKMKSYWSPSDVDPAVELFLKNLESRVLSIGAIGSNYSNLSGEERYVLENLKEYRDIVVKSADKGSAVATVLLYPLAHANFTPLYAPKNTKCWTFSGSIAPII